MQTAPRRTPIALALALALAALALTIAACSSPPASSTGSGATVTPVPTTTVETTSEPPEAPVASSGPIITPATGTALRAAILAAASKGIGVSGKLTVIQLFSQDTAAVGDVQPATGSRMFFALTGGPDEWTIAWSAPFGSPLANIDALQAAAPLVSPALAGKVVWTKKAPKPAKVAKAPTLASFKTFALKAAETMAGPSYTGTFTVTAKIAKDSSGVWWGNADLAPSIEGLEDIGVWGKYSSGKWKGEIADFSTDDAEAEFFPASVISKLKLP